MNVLLLLTATSSMEEIANTVNKFEVSQTYFLQILYSQLAIFSVIVAILVGLYFIFSSRISRKQITEEVEKQLVQIKDDLKEEIKQQMSDDIVKLNSITEELKTEISLAQADVCRTMVNYLVDKNNYQVALGWAIKAAKYYWLGKNDKFIRVSLGMVKNALNNIGQSLEPRTLAVYQEMINMIDNVSYKIEKEAVGNAMNNLLRRIEQQEAKELEK